MIKHEKPVGLMLDRSIRCWTTIAEPVSKSDTFKWGPTTQSVELHGFCLRTPQANEEWKREEVMALPTIFRLAREDKIETCSYSELFFEAFRGPTGIRGGIGDLENGVQIREVEAAVERSFFQGSEVSEYSKGENLTEFVEFLLGLSNHEEGVQLLLSSVPKLPKMTQCGLQNIERLVELCNGLNPKQCRDAFHLWTTEMNSLNYFLTLDKKFINFMTLTSQCELQAYPINPRALLAELGVEDLDPMPFEAGAFISFFDEWGE